MVQKLRTYLKEGFTYHGLEVTGSKEARTYHFLELKKSKKQLLITQKKSCSEIKDLQELVNKKTPLFVCINTPNILTKKIAAENSSSVEALVNQAFPNIDLNGIYFEVSQKDTLPLVTISKKEAVVTILKEFKANQIQVSGFSLGISCFETIAPFLDNGIIQASNHKIEILNKKILEVKSKPLTDNLLYTISGLELSSTNLLSFSQILGNLNKKVDTSNFEDFNAELNSEFKNQRVFNQVLKYALIFFIGLLLANFLGYNHYHGDVSNLNEVLAATSSQKDQLTLLDESVIRKKERVETLSASSNSKATYYLDLFAQKIPKSILLNEIKYQPLAKPVREKKPIILEEEVLLVSGISKDVDAFSFWIEELEKQDWVNSVETLDYNFVSRTTSDFLIEIRFHETR